MMERIAQFWNDASLETLLNMTEEDIATELDKIAIKNSNDKIQITIVDISFECMNEPGREQDGYRMGLVNIDALKIRGAAST